MPEIDREKTVAILGASKETPENAPFIKMAHDVSRELVKLGYNIVTGGGQGVMKAANEGAWDADPSKSFAVNVRAWPEKHDRQIFNELADVNTGAERTDLFRKIAKNWIVFPGGPGTLQELSVGGESKYYGVNPAPDMTLVGKKFQKPLFDYFKNMDALKVARNPQSSYQLADSTEEILEKVVGAKLDLVA